MPTLLAIRGPNIGVRYRLGDVTVIGRAPDSNIQLQDESVSRRHCEIVRAGRSYSVRDLHSRNGLIVNGQRVREKDLLRNDRLDIGSSTFLFNSDFDLKNTQFSNKLVYLSPSQDETIQASTVARRQVPSESVPPVAELGLDALTDLFASTAQDFPAALQGALDAVLRLSKAEIGCVLLWDEVMGDMRPVVATAPEEELALSRRLVQTVFHERQAVLGSNDSIDYRYSPLQRGQHALHSVLCLPLIFQNEPIGVFHLERVNLDQFDLEDVRQLQAVANLMASAIVQWRKVERSPRVEAEEPAREMLGRSAVFETMMQQLERLAPENTPVLVTGETGTGKELIARAIHNCSPRARFPFVAINCAAIPETLFESELFGHERGAFTGAERMSIGVVEQAHGGTIFLDEVGELSLAVQPKLLRFLQEKTYYRVGGVKALSVDVRVIAATNADLHQAVIEKRFREDLYYRLNVINIFAPPLRERDDDVVLLAQHFARRHAERYKRPFRSFSPEALEAMRRYRWPGNVRELENAIERAVLLSGDGMLGEQFIVPMFRAVDEEDEQEAVVDLSREGLPTMRQMEEKMVRLALKLSAGNQMRAAELLQVHRNTIRNKIHEFGIDPADYAG